MPIPEKSDAERDSPSLCSPPARHARARASGSGRRRRLPPSPWKPAGHPAPAPPPPEEKSAVTHHTLTLDGRAYPYTATAGNLLLKDEEGTVKASRLLHRLHPRRREGPRPRPVTFSFNGGPGSASLWVHLGAFGPKIVERTDEGMALPPPGRLVDNPYTLLDQTDLVFIDPVSTGYSRPAPGQDPSSSTASRRTSSRSPSSSGCG